MPVVNTRIHERILLFKTEPAAILSEELQVQVTAGPWIAGCSLELYSNGARRAQAPECYQTTRVRSKYDDPGTNERTKEW